MILPCANMVGLNLKASVWLQRQFNTLKGIKLYEPHRTFRLDFPFRFPVYPIIGFMQQFFRRSFVRVTPWCARVEARRASKITTYPRTVSRGGGRRHRSWSRNALPLGTGYKFTLSPKPSTSSKLLQCVHLGLCGHITQQVGVGRSPPPRWTEPGRHRGGI